MFQVHPSPPLAETESIGDAAVSVGDDDDEADGMDDFKYPWERPKNGGVLGESFIFLFLTKGLF